MLPLRPRLGSGRPATIPCDLATQLHPRAGGPRLAALGRRAPRASAAWNIYSVAYGQPGPGVDADGAKNHPEGLRAVPFLRFRPTPPGGHFFEARRGGAIDKPPPFAAGRHGLLRPDGGPCVQGRGRTSVAPFIDPSVRPLTTPARVLGAAEGRTRPARTEQSLHPARWCWSRALSIIDDATLPPPPFTPDLPALGPGPPTRAIPPDPPGHLWSGLWPRALPPASARAIYFSERESTFAVRLQGRGSALFHSTDDRAAEAARLATPGSRICLVVERLVMPGAGWVGPKCRLGPPRPGDSDIPTLVGLQGPLRRGNHDAGPRPGGLAGKPLIRSYYPGIPHGRHKVVGTSRPAARRSPAPVPF